MYRSTFLISLPAFNEKMWEGCSLRLTDYQLQSILNARPTPPDTEIIENASGFFSDIGDMEIN